MRKSATGRPQVGRVSVDVQNATTRYLTVPSHQERPCTVSKSKTVEGVEQPWW